MKFWRMLKMVLQFKERYEDAYAIDCKTPLTCHAIWWQHGDIPEIMKKYDISRKKEILFYGPSNFARWTRMDEDMKEYKVQNHAFGGCTDVELVGYAKKVLFPYEPAVIFFQTGSNDYVEQKGTNEQKLENCMRYKKAMFEDFHRKLPETKMVAMSGLLLPGRSKYTAMTIELNKQLKTYAETTDFLSYVDADAMTYDGSGYREDLFEKDKIHLNHKGQMTWYKGYIRPAIEKVILENGMEFLRR